MTFLDVFGLSAVAMISIGLLLAVGVLYLDRHWDKQDEREETDGS